MKSLPLALVSTLSVLAAPAAASSQEVINFTFRATEVTTEQGRSALLGRMRATTRAACRGHRSDAYPSPNECRVDLENQFVRAIANPLLMAEYEGNVARIARSGS